MARLPLPPEPRVIARVAVGAMWLKLATIAATRPRSASRREAGVFSAFARRSKRSSSIVAPVPHTQFTTGVARLVKHDVAGLPAGSIACGRDGRHLAGLGAT